MSDRIAEIEARLAEATPGPWKAEPYHLHDEEYGRVRVTSPSDAGIYNTAEAILPHDADFIANAPADIAYLLAELSKQ